MESLTLDIGCHSEILYAGKQPVQQALQNDNDLPIIS